MTAIAAVPLSAGHFTSVRKLEKAPAFARQGGRPSAAQRAGLVYERKAQGFLEKSFGKTLIKNPWVEYTTFDGQQRFCQPDAIIKDAYRIPLTVVEIKHSNTNANGKRAIQQIQLYRELVSTLYDAPCAALVMFGRYDSNSPLPASFRLINRVEDLSPALSVINILPWNPRFD